ncbi:MAG TPA: hypothetical protein VFH85_07655 [Gammaproteobacteria bacterium]|nr:hypothetical protein [Gammaproteobacteria bacterium]
MKTCEHCNRIAAHAAVDCICGERFPLEMTHMDPVWVEWANRRIRRHHDEAAQLQAERELGIVYCAPQSVPDYDLDAAGTSLGVRP